MCTYLCIYIFFNSKIILEDYANQINFISIFLQVLLFPHMNIVRMHISQPILMLKLKAYLLGYSIQFF